MLLNIVYDTSHHGTVLSHDSDLHVENVTNEQSYKYRQWRLVKSNVRQDVFSCHVTLASKRRHLVSFIRYPIFEIMALK